MIKINPQEIRVEKREGKHYLVLPPIEIETPEGKVSSTGKTVGFSYASTGKTLAYAGRIARVTVRFDSPNESGQLVELGV